MKAYNVQYWTDRNVKRDWVVAESPDAAFDKLVKSIPGITRACGLHSSPYEEFPHFAARVRTELREIVIYRYGDSDQGVVVDLDYELQSISSFLSWAANMGADIVAY